MALSCVASGFVDISASCELRSRRPWFCNEQPIYVVARHRETLTAVKEVIRRGCVESGYLADAFIHSCQSHHSRGICRLAVGTGYSDLYVCLLIGTNDFGSSDLHIQSIPLRLDEDRLGTECSCSLVPAQALGRSDNLHCDVHVGHILADDWDVNLGHALRDVQNEVAEDPFTLDSDERLACKWRLYLHLGCRSRSVASRIGLDDDLLRACRGPYIAAYATDPQLCCSSVTLLSRRVGDNDLVGPVHLGNILQSCCGIVRGSDCLLKDLFFVALDIIGIPAVRATAVDGVPLNSENLHCEVRIRCRGSVRVDCSAVYEQRLADCCLLARCGYLHAGVYVVRVIHCPGKAK